LIVDDEELLVKGIRFNLQNDGFETVTGSDGLQAVSLAQQEQPDLIVLTGDNISGGSCRTDMFKSWDANRCERAIDEFMSIFEDYGVPVAAVFGNHDNENALSKEELFDAIRKTAQGVRVVSPEIDRALRENNSRPSLSSRQIEILDSLTRGLTNEDIARQFGLTKAGVKFHLLTIFRKLDVSNRSEAVAVAIRRHLVADS
jgi:DNA-binding NarL/FixJ family response regulator